MARAVVYCALAVLAVACPAFGQFFIDECCIAEPLRTPNPSCCVLSQLTPALTPSQKLLYINTLCSEECSRNYTSCVNQKAQVVSSNTVIPPVYNVSQVNMYAGYEVGIFSLGANFCGTNGPLSGVDCFTTPGAVFNTTQEMATCVDTAFFNSTCPDNCQKALSDNVTQYCQDQLFASPALGAQMRQVFSTCYITPAATIPNAAVSKSSAAVLTAALTTALALLLVAVLGM